MGAKRTAELIPLCHPPPLTGTRSTLHLRGDRVEITTATVRTKGVTGVEMEALTGGATPRRLRRHDQGKSPAVIEEIRVPRASGGRAATGAARNRDDCVRQARTAYDE